MRVEQQIATVVTIDDSGETASLRGIVVRKSWQKSLLTFLMVFGPGLIVMADHVLGPGRRRPVKTPCRTTSAHAPDKRVNSLCIYMRRLKTN